ncbi:low molecular weight protein-tyrosine-phosphatase [Lysinibacter sp. HNR]|uniref:low molecular weight protein-tyrosine-phosphatase n=1 Tax=Lysinibacter sp. HNR TaxID=3031408 RepID=UPI00325A58A9
MCTGNICRSPMAEIVFRNIVTQAGLKEDIKITSRGTGDWHVGEQADARTIATLKARGYSGEEHRARKLSSADFENNDLIIALDRTHLRVLKGFAPNQEALDKVELLMSLVRQPDDDLDVPDPYYSDEAMFNQVLTMIEEACTALFQQLEPAIRRKNNTA